MPGVTFEIIVPAKQGAPANAVSTKAQPEANIGGEKAVETTVNEVP